MVEFTPTDSDLVFRRKERFILAGVFVLDGLLFAGIVAYVFSQKPQEAWIAAGVLTLALASLGLVAAWLWTFEVRFTPYEFVMRSMFGAKVVQYSNISRLHRQRVPGKVPAQYQLRLETQDGFKWTVPDISEQGTSVLAELRSRCRGAEIIDEQAPTINVHNSPDE